MLTGKAIGPMGKPLFRRQSPLCPRSWSRVFCTVAAVIGLALTSCSREDRIRLTNADSGRQITVGVDAQIEITLQTIGPGEYSDPQVSSGSVRLVGVSSLTPPPAGSRQLFRFQAAAPGRADIMIPHTGQNPLFTRGVEVE